MKKGTASIAAIFFALTLCPAIHAAQISPQSISDITHPQPRPLANIQPAIPQPNFSTSSVPAGTNAIQSDQTINSAPPNLIPAFDFDPVVTLQENYKYKDAGWKSSDRYEISRIEGLNSTYVADEKIVFEVSGWSGALEVNEVNGFNVMATLFELPANRVNRAKTTYNPATRVWQSRFSVPLDNTKEYKILINLYCEKNNSPCTTTFGERTQVDKIFPIQPL